MLPFIPNAYAHYYDYHFREEMFPGQYFYQCILFCPILFIYYTLEDF